MRVGVVVMVLLFGSFVVDGIGAETETDCGQLLELRCQSCHFLGRVCRQVGEKSKKRWLATLKRMVKRREAKVSEEEQKILVHCLGRSAPGILAACKQK